MTTKLLLQDRDAITSYILQGLEFQAGSMSGAPRNTWSTPREDLLHNLTNAYVSSNWGGHIHEPRQLKGYTLNTWVNDGLTNHVDYVVWSYAEPIAWHVSDGEDHWVVVHDKFSSTTSRHQSIVRDAMSMVTRVCVVGADGWKSDWVPARYNDSDDAHV